MDRNGKLSKGWIGFFAFFGVVIAIVIILSTASLIRSHKIISQAQAFEELITKEGGWAIYPHQQSAVIQGLTLIDASSVQNCFAQMEATLASLQSLEPQYIEGVFGLFICIDQIHPDGRSGQYSPDLNAVFLTHQGLFSPFYAGDAEASLVHEAVHAREWMEDEPCERRKEVEILAFRESYDFLEKHFGFIHVSPESIEIIVDNNYDFDC